MANNSFSNKLKEEFVGLKEGASYKEQLHVVLNNVDGREKLSEIKNNTSSYHLISVGEENTGLIANKDIPEWGVKVGYLEAIVEKVVKF